MPANRPPREEHLAMTRTVEAYLAYVARPARRWRSPEVRQQRIDEIKTRLRDEDMSNVARLKLTQLLRNHEAALAEDDMEDPTEDFIKVCLPYSELHGIEYETWKELGVSPSVLKRAGW